MQRYSVQGIKALLFLSSIFLSFTSHAGQQAELAVEHVKSLIASGEVRSGEVLHLVAKQGNIANFLGDSHQLKARWETETGTSIDVHTMPQVASLNFIRQAENVDLTIARNREYADLYQQLLIENLRPYADRFQLGVGMDNDLILPVLQAEFAGNQVAIPADGDLAILYLRRDLLDDPNHQARYQKLYGKALQAPETWQEYQQQVEFFHMPDRGIVGSLEQRDQSSGWMFWMLRYASQSLPNQLLFDEDMNPLINSPEGIAATESYIATVPFSPEGILNKDSNYTFTLPRFLNGKGYSTIITLAGAKIFNLPHSKVRGDFIAVPMPGVRIGDKLNRRTTLIYGNNLVIPKRAQNKELAYLFAMWLTDPDISVEAIGTKGGFSDPYRFSHLSNSAMQKIYTAEVLNTVQQDLPHTVPAGTGLPGDTEYISILNKQIFLAASGVKTAQEAMRDVAAGWQDVTNKYGRESQKVIWHEIRKNYPGQNNKNKE
ncbi:extracellular solute-binding protein [Neptuniibacter sp.]|uniref:extracellular solute-binding protein n=1 Tax=Neptuniibacter sp. TaxID=1962643 RepID=UPI00261B749C|nr:extracellular solute-binding protein [Neptuniibacter sp.]MCP4595499.1 extracellular solute-binding protein [Neptuniibacter sp.]